MSRPRYAVYFAPAHGSPWWRFGAGWLGRDEQRDARLQQAQPAGFSPVEFEALTAEPRRYGFHATLKAPFRLRDSVSEDLLLRRLAALAAGLRAVPLGSLRPLQMAGFVALVPTPRQPGVDALAAHCMLDLDDLRAPDSAADIARRRPELLDDMGRDLLARYGYPHVLGRFRFHLTLSGPVDEATATRLLAQVEPAVAHLNAAGARTPGSAVPVPRGRARRAFRADPRRGAGAMRAGQWVLVCGPSGAGKDSLLAWTRQALTGHARVCFARRIVTRGAGPHSDHDEASPAALQALRASGGLAWHWQAHGHHYGVRVDYARQVAAGQVVVVNGSREHALPLAGRSDVRCVLVTAPVAILRDRLHARGREDGAAVAARLARNDWLAPPPADRVIVNDGSVATAGTVLRDYLLELAS